MGRAKLPMELINDSKKRKITFQKRKEGIIKKASELSTLCDVKLSMIIFNNDETPQLFPPDNDNFKSLIKHYIKTRATDHTKIKTYDLFDFFKDRNNKIEEELVKTKKKNLEAKYPTWFDFLNDVSEEKLREFGYVLGCKIDNVVRRIEFLKSKACYLDQGDYAKNVVNYVNPMYGDQNQNNNMIMMPMTSDQDYVNYCDTIKTIGYNNNFDDRYDDFSLQNCVRSEDNELAGLEFGRHTQELIRDGVFNLI